MFKRFSKKSKKNSESNDDSSDEQFINDIVTDIQNNVKSTIYRNISMKNDDTKIEDQKVLDTSQITLETQESVSLIPATKTIKTNTKIDNNLQSALKLIPRISSVLAPQSGTVVIHWYLTLGSSVFLSEWHVTSILTIYPKDYPFLATTIYVAAEVNRSTDYSASEVYCEFMGANVADPTIVISPKNMLKVAVKGFINSTHTIQLKAEIANPIITNPMSSYYPNSLPQFYSVHIRGGFNGGELTDATQTKTFSRKISSQLSAGVPALFLGKPFFVADIVPRNINKIIRIIGYNVFNKSDIQRLDLLVKHIDLGEFNYAPWKEIKKLLDETERTDDDLKCYIAKLQCAELNDHINRKHFEPINVKIEKKEDKVTLTTIDEFEEKTNEYHFFSEIKIKKNINALPKLHAKYYVYGFKYYNAVFYVTKNQGHQLLDLKSVCNNKGYKIEFNLYKLRENTEFAGLDAECKTLKITNDFVKNHFVYKYIRW